MLYYDISKGNTGVYINNSEYSNGNSIDLDGNHITAEHGGRAISKRDKNGNRTVIADNFDGKIKLTQ